MKKLRGFFILLCSFVFETFLQSVLVAAKKKKIYIYIYMQICIFYDHLKKSLLPTAQPTESQGSDKNAKPTGN